MSTIIEIIKGIFLAFLDWVKSLIDERENQKNKEKLEAIEYMDEKEKEKNEAEEEINNIEEKDEEDTDGQLDFLDNFSGDKNEEDTSS
jgi:hypothetical protein